ncbi:hypothetical protein B0H13DRAFT_2352551 [Mycena leptocephala]|nr:hypothetical protein B0H13DRAFT_2352551 [Mycena leptocephala]
MTASLASSSTPPPSGPLSNDTTSIHTLAVITPTDNNTVAVAANVAPFATQALQTTACLLGISPEDLQTALTTREAYAPTRHPRLLLLESADCLEPRPTPLLDATSRRALSSAGASPLRACSHPIEDGQGGRAIFSVLGRASLVLKAGKNERPQRGAPHEASTRVLRGHTATPTSRPARAHMGVNHYAGPCARVPCWTAGTSSPYPTCPPAALLLVNGALSEHIPFSTAAASKIFDYTLTPARRTLPPSSPAARTAVQSSPRSLAPS